MEPWFDPVRVVEHEVSLCISLNGELNENEVKIELFWKHVRDRLGQDVENGGSSGKEYEGEAVAPTSDWLLKLVAVGSFEG